MELCLWSVHLHTCSTPCSHTYLSEAHGSVSTIDHILAPEHLIPRFSGCYVAEDDPLNLSDHSPVSTSLSFSLPSSPTLLIKKLAKQQFQPNWVRAKKLKLLPTYTELIEFKLWEIPLPDTYTLIGSPSCVERLLSSITDTLKRTAQECIPPKHFQPYLRPGWGSQLQQAHSKSKRLYKAWISACRPRANSNLHQWAYKEAEAVFHAQLRKSQRAKRLSFVILI